jgi:hypothetical protein
MQRRPVRVMWSGASFVPEDRFMPYCRHWFGVGEVLLIDPEQERDMNSHRHYFAQLKTGWDNLPERLVEKYPTLEIFRKKLLIECGYFHEATLICDTAASAATTAAFMAPLDPSAVIVVRGRMIRRYVAKSQSVAAMGREEFQRSKWDVLNAAAALIEVTPKQLERETKKLEYDGEGTEGAA